MSRLLIDPSKDQELIENILDEATYPLTAGAIDDLKFKPMDGEAYTYERPPGLAIFDDIKWR